MRTTLFLFAGIMLMASALILGRLFGGEYPAARGSAIWIAGVVWLGLTALNLWTGVAKAGYSVREELPIFLLLFAVPVVVGVVGRRFVA
jgi:uncharacterized membrane protein YwaF